MTAAKAAKSPPGKKKSSKPTAKKTGKKKSSRKKASKSSIKALVLSFLGGLLVACALLFYAANSYIDKPDAFIEKARKAKDVPVQAPKVAGKSSEALPKTTAAASSAKGQSRIEGAIADLQNQNTLNEKAAKNLFRGKADLKSPPFDESLSTALDEQIRHIDYAIVQAAWIKKLPASSLRIALVEDRLSGAEPYHYQIIDILPGETAGPFIETLKESLLAWTAGSVLVDEGNFRYGIYSGDVKTHHVRLYPDYLAFPDNLPQPQTAPIPPATAVAPPYQQSPASTPRLIDKIPGADILPRNQATGPKMVIVIDDMGASVSAVSQLLALDYPVTFAFWPSAAHTPEGAVKAHASGMEILVHQPMQPLNSHKQNSGAKLLKVGMQEFQIRQIVREALGKVPHAVGLNNHMGSRFTQNQQGVNAVISELLSQGVFMLDSVTHAQSVFADEGKKRGIETYRRDVFLDHAPTRNKVLAELRRAEHIALITGQSVAIGHPLPVTLAALKEWEKLRNPKVQLVRLQDLKQ